MIIALGSVSDKSWLEQTGVLTAIGIGMTIFVYGLVGLIVKADDFGFWLKAKQKNFTDKIADSILWLMPKFMKFLGFLGTVAMFSVGGGILNHSVPFLHHINEKLGAFSMGMDIGIGIILGAVCVGVFEIASKLFKRKELAK